MIQTLTLLIFLPGATVPLQIPYETGNDCEITKGFVEQYIPGAKAECRWEFKDTVRG